MFRLLSTARSGRTMTCTAVLAALCLTGATAHASVVRSETERHRAPVPVVVTTASLTHIVVSIAGSAPQVLTLMGRPVSLVVADVNHDGFLDLSALLPHRRLLVWLNEGERGFSQLHSQTRTAHTPPKPRRWGIKRSALQHALHIGTARVTRTGQANQATSSGQLSLSEPPRTHVVVASRPLQPFFSARILSNDRSGRRPSRAPPLAAII